MNGSAASQEGPLPDGIFSNHDIPVPEVQRVAKTKTADTEVKVNRRKATDRRNEEGDRRSKDVPVAVERRKVERRAKVSRRRQIDPTTCERDYTEDEVEFMNALDEYKRASGRMFPTCSEVLEVVRNLGYEKRAPIDPATEPAADAETVEATTEA